MMALLIEAAVRSLLLGLAVGLVLRFAKVQNPQVEMTAWIVVLAGSLAMPLLMQLTVAHLPAEVVRLPHVVLGTDPEPAVIRTIHSHTAAVSYHVAGSSWSWLGLLTVGYGLVVAALLLRLAAGLIVTWAIVRDARPIRADWTRGADVRVTARILAPVTFGRVILVPISFISWGPAKRRAVMGHELSHIEHHDFTVQVLSQLHSAIFWFSPFAWWLQVRLATLAETTSDEAAILKVGDRVGYAEILLDIATGAKGLPAGIAMARPALLRDRVEHILSKAAPVVRLTRRARVLLGASLLPAVLLIGGTSWHAQAAGSILPTVAIPAIPAIPPVPPIPPIPAIPAIPVWDEAPLHGDTRPFAILTGGHSMISAEGDALKRLMNARGKVGSEAILFIGADDKIYGVTDPVLVEQGADMFRPETSLADQERELADQQKEIGREQAEIGRQQGRIGTKMGDVSQRYAEEASRAATKVKFSADGDANDEAAAAGDTAKQKYKDAMEELNQEQRELGREQGQLGAQQAKLGTDQAKLGREQSRVAHEGDLKLAKLLDAAVTSGAARVVE